jgi:hypothetical protein
MEIKMGERAKHEDDLLRQATAAAIDGARKVSGNPPLMNTPVGKLSDLQWGWIATAVIFAWTRTRSEQAIADGRDQEQMILATGLSPDPCDVAVVSSILAELADTAQIDWGLSLREWPRDVMVSFLLLAWTLIRKAEHARDHAPGTVLRKPPASPELVDDSIPF